MKNITESQFAEFMIVFIVCLCSYAIHATYQEDVRNRDQKIEFAKDCEDKGLNFASMNQNWVCVRRYESAQ